MNRFDRARASLGTAALAVVLVVSSGGVAHAQQSAIRNLGVTDYWIDYTRHARGFADDVPILPRFNEGSPWSSIKALLMPKRSSAHALYLLGDDRLHLFPTRVGVLGWGMSAGLQF